MAKSSFFTFSMEETALHKFFSSADKKFAHYDDAITKQSAAIQAISDQLMRLRKSSDQPDRQPEFDARLTAVHSAVGQIQGALDGRSQLWQSVSDRLCALEKELTAELSTFRVNVEVQLANATRDTREWAQQLVGQVNQIPMVIDANRTDCETSHRGLSEMIRQSDEQIRELKEDNDRFRLKIESLTSEMKTLKAELLHKSEDQSTTFRAELCALKNDRPVFTVRSPEADLSSFELRPEPLINPDSPPRVPPIPKFSKVPEAIEYLYELVPTLQSILTASYRRVTQKLSDFQNRDSRIYALQSELAQLASTISTLATREELAGAMRRRSSGRECRGIGLVKCISCGRELSNDDPPQRLRGPSGRLAFSIVEEPRPSCTSQRTVSRRIQKL